jgi:uncharacterized protein with ParB-like and HNH nuclease domain
MQTIDGQQRIITLFLLIKIIFSLLKNGKSKYKKYILDVFCKAASLQKISDDDNNNNKYKIFIQDDYKECFNKIMNLKQNKKFNCEKYNNNIEKKFYENYDNIMELLNEKLNDKDIKDNKNKYLLKLFSSIINNIKMLKIVTRDFNLILQIFKFINSTELNLRSIDLIKYEK